MLQETDSMIRAFRAWPSVEIRQTAPARAIQGSSTSVNGTLPASSLLPAGARRL